MSKLEGGRQKMSILFSISELLNVAVEIERNGLAFYETLAKSSKDKKAQSAYSYLADMERGHIRVFKDMLDTVGQRNLPADAYTEEYGLYLKTLIDSAVFSHTEAARKMAQRVAGSAEAIQIAIATEKDSILFYSEMQHLVPERERGLVDRIIDEERSHLRHLSELQRELAEGG